MISRPAGLLEQVAAHPRFEGLKYVLRGRMHGKHHDAHVRLLGQDLARRLHPVELGHGNVENGDARLELQRLRQGLPAVGRGADDLEVRLRGEMGNQPVPHDRVIVGHEHCRSHQIDPWAMPHDRARRAGQL